MTTTKTKWVLDPTHSEIQFKAKHLMITNVTGSFADFTANVETEEENIETAAVTFTAKVGSIYTGNEQRDGHLKSADFFDAENFPEIHFKSTTFKKTAENNYEVSGNLTIKDHTHPVTLQTEYHGIQKDPWGNRKAGFSLHGKINRKEWGLNWNAALETGGMLVSEEVKIMAEVQFTKQA